MAKINVIISTKGGVGKTVLSTQIMPAIYTHLGLKFQIFEIDNNNTSNVFHKSNIIKNNMQTVKTNDKNISADIVYQTMVTSDQIIVDAGGGDDALKVIEIVKSIGEPVNWFIPLNRNLAQLQNAIGTFERINEPQNTYFILNGYTSSSPEDIKDEFLFYFGNANMGIEGIRQKLKIQKEFAIPFSNYFEIAAMQNFTVGDLAKISQELGKDEAKALFFQKFQNDRPAFLKAWADYQNSERAAALLDVIFQDFVPFFSNGTEKEPRRTKGN